MDHEAAARVYSLDEDTGTIRFGDGQHGAIPPIAADAIVAFQYERTDPATSDGVPANFVTARSPLNLVTPVESVEAVIAADQAAGGVAPESGERVLRFGAAKLRHRGRAVTAHDFEDLALERFADVVQARCFVRGGRVQLVVVMRGGDPKPSQAQRRELRSVLLAASAAGLASPGMLRIEGPTVRRFRIQLRLRVATLDVAGDLANYAKRTLELFFNTDTSRESLGGWALGASPREDDIAEALLDAPNLGSIISIGLTEVDAAGSEHPWPQTIKASELAMLAGDGIPYRVRDHGGCCMNRLAPNLFDRRFGDLVALGRARLPSLAPAWTDHNAHDPGITLMELLAWVAEAQIYSLARTRRDEREAYAALLGLAPSGTRPASGLIWPDYNDSNYLAATASRHFIIEHSAAIHTSNSEVPTFRPTHRMLWIPAHISALVTHLGNGMRINHTGANARGGPAFQPFGETGDRNDVLWMDLETPDKTPFIPAGLPDDACLVIGVRADGAQVCAPDEEESRNRKINSPIEITLSSGAARFPLKIVEDTSDGFMRTGVFVIDLSGIQVASNSITLEFRAPSGFDRAPRVLRIGLNVIPISQSRHIDRELHVAQGLPDQGFDLETQGLQFVPAKNPVKVEVSDGGSFVTWEKCDRLSDYGPDDRVYELNATVGRVTFGNGINGAMPAAGAQVVISYDVCDGIGWQYSTKQEVGNARIERHARGQSRPDHGRAGTVQMDRSTQCGAASGEGWARTG